jgi:hypothetical protein
MSAAGDYRLGLTLAADCVRLLAIFAEDLRYAHSPDDVKTKALLLDTITSGLLK